MGLALDGEHLMFEMNESTIEWHDIIPDLF